MRTNVSPKGSTSLLYSTLLLYLNADLDVGNEGRRGLGFRFDVERVHLDLFAVQRFDQRDLPVAIDRELDRIVELTVLTGNDAEVEGRIVKR